MNETLQNAVKVLIEKSLSGLETATTFLVAEIPDVIHQLLVWKMLISSLSFLFFIVAIAVFTIVIYKNSGIKRDEKGNVKNSLTHTMSSGDRKVPELGPQIILTVPCIVVGYVVIYDFLFSIDWLQILVSPKIYLIEYAASFAK